MEWARWYETADAERIVAQTGNEALMISTVFLGLDHNFYGRGPPLLFETMVFGGEHDGDQWRCATWTEAEADHRRAVALVFPALV